MEPMVVGIGLASQTGDALLSVPLLERGKFAFDLQQQARLINATSHSLKGRGTWFRTPNNLRCDAAHRAAHRLDLRKEACSLLTGRPSSRCDHVLRGKEMRMGELSVEKRAQVMRVCRRFHTSLIFDDILQGTKQSVLEEDEESWQRIKNGHFTKGKMYTHKHIATECLKSKQRRKKVGPCLPEEESLGKLLTESLRKAGDDAEIASKKPQKSKKNREKQNSKIEKRGGARNRHTRR